MAPAPRPRAGIPPGGLAGAGFALGIAATPGLDPHFAFVLAPLAALLLVPGLRGPRSRQIGIALAFALLGACRAGLERGPALGRRDPLEEGRRSASPSPSARLAAIEGTVASVPVLRSSDESLDRSRPSNFDASGEGLLTVQAEGGGSVRVLVRRARRSDLRLFSPGARLRIRGLVLPPRSARNPGDRPAPPGGARRLIVVPGPRSIALLPSRESRPPWILALRARLHRIIDELCPAREAGILQALLLGERRLLSTKARDLLEQTGTYHYLAISGLHVGMLLVLLRRFPAPRGCRTALRLLALGLFAALTGGSTPVLRAVLMACFQTVATRAGRVGDARSALGWAIVVILAWDPGTVSDAGFLLSAVAVSAILTWGRRLARTRDELRAWRPAGVGAASRPAWRWLAAVSGSLRRALAVSVVTSIATAPLVAFYFGRFQPLGALWTVALWPLIALALISGLATLATGLLVPALAAPFAIVATESVRALLVLLDAFAHVPPRAIDIPPPQPATVLLVYGLLAVSLRGRRCARFACGAGIAALFVLLARGAIGIDAPRIVHFDVGRGTAVLVRLAPRGAVLLDAGGTGARAGQRLLGALGASGVARLDAVILSHVDSDHTDALPLLLERLPIGGVYAPPHAKERARGRWLAELAARRGISFRFLARGDELVLSGRPRAHIRVLYPNENENLPLAEHSNEVSLVLRVDIGEESYLSTGDIEEGGIARLLSGEDDLSAGLLLLPHHGRSNRLLPILLDAVRPHTVLISGDGEGGARETAARLEATGLRVFATWRDGAILGPSRPGGKWRRYAVDGER